MGNTVLQENMVITIEPSISVEDGRILVSEENIVVRDDAPELLTKRASHEILVINYKIVSDFNSFKK